MSLCALVLVSCAQPENPEGNESAAENTRQIRNGTVVNTPSVTGKLLVSGFLCTATLVGPSTILTAAHCVSGDPLVSNPQGAIYAANQFSFSLNGQTRTIASVVRHPGYLPPNIATLIGGTSDQDNGGADLAILKLSSPLFSIQYQDTFNPSNAFMSSPGAQFNIFGFGRDQNNVSGVLSAGTVVFNALLPSTELVGYNVTTRRGQFQMRYRGLVEYLPGPGDQLSCKGDSGGGAFIYNTLSGILSSASIPSGTAPADYCRRATRVYYTAATAYRPWIENTRKALDPNITTSVRLSGPSTVTRNRCVAFNQRSFNSAGAFSLGGASQILAESSAGVTLYRDAQCNQALAQPYGVNIPLGSSGVVFYVKATSAGLKSIGVSQGVLGPIPDGQYFPLTGQAISFKVN